MQVNMYWLVPQLRSGGFAAVKFYFLHAIADGT